MVGKRAYDIVTYLWAYAWSLRCNRYDAPARFERYAQLEGTIAEERYTLGELAAEYDLNTSCLSEEGRRCLGTPRR